MGPLNKVTDLEQSGIKYRNHTGFFAAELFLALYLKDSRKSLSSYYVNYLLCISGPMFTKLK